jgi:4-hydroxy-L-threonine phosphate dehydrogenase PdxA
MTSKFPRIALTPGEPAGIGPDICLQWALEDIAAEVVAFADPDMLRQRARQLGLAVRLEVSAELQFPSRQPGVLRVWPMPCAAPVEPGRLNPASARCCRTRQRGLNRRVAEGLEATPPGFCAVEEPRFCHLFGKPKSVSNPG